MRDFWKSGDPYAWLTGAALVFSLLMVGGLLLLIITKGLGFFWPSRVVVITLKDGSKYMGQEDGSEHIPTPEARGSTKKYRIRLKIGNRDLYGLDFRWTDKDDIVTTTYPSDAVIIERTEWGNMYGLIRAVNDGGKPLASGHDTSAAMLKALLPENKKLRKKISTLEKDILGGISTKIEQLRLQLNSLGKDDTQSESQRIKTDIETLQGQYNDKEAGLVKLKQTLGATTVVMQSLEGTVKDIPLSSVVRFYEPNDMGVLSKTGVYISKFWEFISDQPREANTEGGVFPAIFGTVFMVLVMSMVVMPFGVLAAVYLKEYARQGLMVKIVRICVNNLAGVPSMVFGVFGLGFFIYGIGGTIDLLFFKSALPTPTFGTGGVLWASLTLTLLTLPVVIVSTEEGLAAVPQDIKYGSLSLGANRFETLVHIIIPAAMPGILTGLILAIARAAGEVAPLMLTGVVKLAPSLPIDTSFPFIHLERKFMHLGFHIYDVGFQSPNVEAAKPMVYMTTFLLIVIVVFLNLTAIRIRNHLKKKYTSSAF
ncbi:phosphate ABC transporter permease PstA [Candidatus Magnetobacterium casense]|uniref:Phosphate transport system permease protein PstA n=1 Tax=Candidatus Magnetobacterium casense TaxID=1455061 RepID=A0ABS6S3H0_9BACT|nr:phosphate ABC transporter permease PstA [Candidatus Magnetobacterium casensis]MBV6342924.1 phosphate ABC transporter permease PstA [Candidatus Magnetobacterium casensis]